MERMDFGEFFHLACLQMVHMVMDGMAFQVLLKVYFTVIQNNSWQSLSGELLVLFLYLLHFIFSLKLSNKQKLDFAFPKRLKLRVWICLKWEFLGILIMFKTKLLYFKSPSLLGLLIYL